MNNKIELPVKKKKKQEIVILKDKNIDDREKQH